MNQDRTQQLQTDLTRSNSGKGGCLNTVFAVGLMILMCGDESATQHTLKGQQGGDHSPERKGSLFPDSFDLSDAIIPVDQIVPGGPGKDGIPALSQPRFISAAEANRQFRAHERVVGVVMGKDVRAYPLSILTWHECVNDTVDGVPLAVTYCPLCDSIAVFERRIREEVLEFGISGLLYNSNVLLYDRVGDRSASLWSQVKMVAVTGPRAGMRLRNVPALTTTWDAWRQENPETLMLSPQTGYARDYGRKPYQAYYRDPTGLMFPVEPLDRRRALKERILGVRLSQVSRAYAEHDLPRNLEFTDVIAGHLLRMRYDLATRTIRLLNPPPGADAVYAFWFSWAAMHPETSIFDPSASILPPAATGPDGG